MTADAAERPDRLGRPVGRRAEDEYRAVLERPASLREIDPAHGEPLQGQRYDVDQEFKPHCDWFNPDGQDYEKYCSVAGQRTWTFMIYLNEPEAGGAPIIVTGDVDLEDLDPDDFGGYEM